MQLAAVQPRLRLALIRGALDSERMGNGKHCTNTSIVYVGPCWEQKDVNERHTEHTYNHSVPGAEQVHGLEVVFAPFCIGHTVLYFLEQ